MSSISFKAFGWTLLSVPLGGVYFCIARSTSPRSQLVSVHTCLRMGVESQADSQFSIVQPSLERHGYDMGVFIRL